MDFLEDSTFERDLSPVARLLAAHDFPDPSEVFLQKLSSEINKQDITKMKEAQEHMLQRFEKTNEMLLNFNSLSGARYEATAREFKHHTQLLSDMKTDLNDVFKRIRSLKTQLSKQYPDAFKAHGQVANVLEEEEEEDEDEDTISENLPVATSSVSSVPPTASGSHDNSQSGSHTKAPSIPSIIEPTDPGHSKQADS